MKRKATATTLLTVLLMGTLSSMLCIEEVGASGTVYIRPDGSIDPPTAPIKRAGDIYTFTDNIYETIVMQKNNIIIDGNGYTLQGAGSGTGFDLSNINNVTITKTRITEWDYGVHLYKSSRNTVRNNNLTKNVGRAIFLSNSSDNTIHDNTIVNNVGEGIFLWLTNTTTINGNNVSSNGVDGISIGYSSFYNTIINNNVFNNSEAGISQGFETFAPTGNIIIGNNITSNFWGIHIYHCHGNTFYYNNLRNNTKQVVIVGATNTWDNGYPSGGNYWSDYTGKDLDGDGIGDTAHVIDADNRDRYPFMNPWTPKAYDTAITDITPFKTVVGQGCLMRINATMTNQGCYIQTFNVTTYANSAPIETERVTLESGNSKILTFTWNTTGFAKGNYTISAYAKPVPGEIDIADNTRIGGTVVVTILGDANGDRRVDAIDLFDMSRAYGSDPSKPNWNPNCDFNEDNKVDASDLFDLNKNYGKTDP